MAELSRPGRIVGSLGGMGQISGGLSVPETVHARRYEGDYTVVPNYTDQTLETQGKLMTDDVTVIAIPVSIVENLSGGNTVYIGG